MRFTKIFLFIFFVGMSLAALVGGAYMIVKTISLKTNGKIVTAEFTGYLESPSSRPIGQPITEEYKDRYHRQYKFLVGSDTIVAATAGASDETGLVEGDQVVIVYDMNDPQSIAEQDKLNDGLVAGIVCFVLGLLVLLITVFIRRKLREQATGMEGPANN